MKQKTELLSNASKLHLGKSVARPLPMRISYRGENIENDFLPCTSLVNEITVQIIVQEGDHVQ